MAGETTNGNGNGNGRDPQLSDDAPPLAKEHEEKPLHEYVDLQTNTSLPH